MFYNTNLYKVGLMNSQRQGGQRSTSVTFSTREIPGADPDIDQRPQTAKDQQLATPGCQRYYRLFSVLFSIQ